MMGALKRVYQGVALLALLNLAAVSGLVGYLVATGQLTGERVERAAAALQGEPPAERAAEAETVAETASPKQSSDVLQRNGEDEEAARLRTDRRRAELEQQAATIAAGRLEMTRQREAFERRQAEVRAQTQQREQQEQSAGFRKELDLLSSVKPKVALEYLLEKPKEDAAALLLAMDTRQGKRLVEAAKNASQRRAMAEVLQMLREMSPEQAEALEQSEGK